MRDDEEKKIDTEEDYDAVDDDIGSDKDESDGLRTGGSSAQLLQSHRGRLRSLQPVKYTATAVPDAITTPDQPTVGTALRSPERAVWMKAIGEVFNIINDNST